METFAMVLAEQPRSFQNQKGDARATYRNKLQQAARERHGGIRPLAGRLYVRVVSFHAVRFDADVDNVLKPILDALKGCVYDDDRSVVACASIRVDTQRGWSFGVGSPATEAIDELQDLLVVGEPFVLYVEVGPETEQVANHGPV